MISFLAVYGCFGLAFVAATWERVHDDVRNTGKKKTLTLIFLFWPVLVVAMIQDALQRLR